jgi:hypothetical protein
VIDVDGLTKTFRVHQRPAGIAAAMRALFHRSYENITAVDHLTFQIEPGERVGFLGPNGAGKTTTLKILAGLLHPSSGSVRVAGHVPQQRDLDFLRQITLVMGQNGFPIELILGHHGRAAALHGLGVMGLYVAGLLALLQLVWRLGIGRWNAYGACGTCHPARAHDHLPDDGAAREAAPLDRAPLGRRRGGVRLRRARGLDPRAWPLHLGLVVARPASHEAGCSNGRSAK